MQLYVIFDACDGRIVGHFLNKQVASQHIVDFLIPKISAQRDFKQIQHPKFQCLLIHSDRGEQFRSNAYMNLEIVFNGFLILSHSIGGTPTDNSPVERWFRTFKSKALWEMVGYPNGQPTQIDTLKEYETLIDNVIQLYNSKHVNKRSLNMTPNQAHFAFYLIPPELAPPEYLLAYNDAWGNEIPSLDVANYRKQVEERRGGGMPLP